MPVNVLITGANFNNKGAQSMLFVAIDELRKRIPDSEIYFGCGLGDPALHQVHFRQICFSREGRYIALGGGQAVFNFLVAVAKACIWTVKGKRSNLWNFFDVSKYIADMDLIVDVSGFALGDKWSKRTNENFLNTIRLARRHNIPMYIMPQSFGPFQYSRKLEYLKEEIAELLKYPKVVYAREQEGYELLTRDFGLTNVRLSCDLVLQNTGIDYGNIYEKMPPLCLPEIKTKKNVGIVPNKHCFRHGNDEQILAHYRRMIDCLLEGGREVYIFRHSGEDMPYCVKIAEMYDREERVHLLKNDFSCMEYDAFVNNFEFILCSRFHGIVHAYRNAVPVIALGWAVKYRELTAAVGQSAYIFDITDPACDGDKLTEAVNHMMEHIDEEKNTITRCVEALQKQNCFVCISEWKKENHE